MKLTLLVLVGIIAIFMVVFTVISVCLYCLLCQHRSPSSDLLEAPAELPSAPLIDEDVLPSASTVLLDPVSAASASQLAPLEEVQRQQVLGCLQALASSGLHLPRADLGVKLRSLLNT